MELGSVTLKRIGFFVFQLNTQHTLFLLVPRHTLRLYTHGVTAASESRGTAQPGPPNFEFAQICVTVIIALAYALHFGMRGRGRCD